MAPASIEKARRKAFLDADIIPALPVSSFNCPACMMAKSTHHVPKPTHHTSQNRHPATESTTPHNRRRLDLIYSDLCGPFPIPSLGGSIYYISFIDDVTRVTWVQFLKRKSDASTIIKNFTLEMETQYDAHIKAFQTDNGGEYINHDLLAFFKSKGIKHRLTPPYSPESNGVAERLNRTIGEALRAMLIPMDNKRLWAEACLHFVYTRNRTPHRALGGRTPYEAFHGAKPSISHLQPFGRPCYIHIPESRRGAGSKLSPRAMKGLLVGYTNVERHYRIFIPEKNRTIVSGDVLFPPFETEEAFAPPTENHDPAGQQIHFTKPNRSPEIPNPRPTTTNIKVPQIREVDDIAMLEWCDRNPEKAIDLFKSGHITITRILQQAVTDGKRDGVLDPRYLTIVPDPKDPSYVFFGTPSMVEASGLSKTPDAPDTAQPIPSLNSPIALTPDGSPPLRHEAFLQTPHQHETSNPIHRPSQENPIPNSPPQNHVRRTTRVNAGVPPGEWWKVQGSNLDQPTTVTPRNPDLDVQMESSPIEETIILEKRDEVAFSSSIAQEPKSYQQAQTSPDWPQWKQAIDEELASLRENDVWEVVSRPANRRIVDCKWVFKIKTDSEGKLDRYKARLVARGFTQVPGDDFDETFSPVVRYDSMRLLLAISAANGWRPRQLDVKTAFLYGVLREEVYMHLPEGHREQGKVARLKRCLYGLKQSSREWYFRLIDFLTPHGFFISEFDPCVLAHESGRLFVAIYVDDITMFGAPSNLMDQTVTRMKSEFKVNDMGQLHWLLGIRIDFTNEGIRLSQEAYVDKILKKFEMADCHPVSTPLDANQRLRAPTTGEPRTEATRYQRIIGSINYLVTATRPDLAYTIAHLSQYSKDPSAIHFACLKRILRYLKGTRHRSLLYRWHDTLTLSGFSDASHGNFLDNRCSFSGYIFCLGSSVFSWRSRKQRSTAYSTAESEYMALAMAAKQYVWIQRGIKEFVKTDVPSALFCDNTAAIDLSHNPKLNDRTKHIDIAYHFVRQYVEAGTITLLHVSSNKNLADICTKALPRPIFEQLCTSIFGTILGTN